MIISSHVGAGALVGTAVRQPVPAFLLGFASHLAMDALPHWGLPPGGNWLPVARRDGVAGLVEIGLITAAAPTDRRIAVLAGMIGACLPDTDKLGTYFFKRNPWPEPFNRFHARIQRESAHRLPREVLTAATLGAVALAILGSSRS
ncbi:MAG: hypothetical protein ACQSGP_00505 [Frankia sp.]